VTDEMPEGHEDGGDLAYVPAGGLIVDWGFQVGTGTGAESGVQMVVLVITAHDGTMRRYVMPAAKAREVAANLVQRADEIAPAPPASSPPPPRA
jgi:hypothetical protein